MNRTLMPHLTKGILFLVSFFVLHCLPASAHAQQNIPGPGKIDSTGSRPPGTFADSTGAAREDSVRADSLRPVPDTLGRMSTPSLVGTLDRSMDSAHYVTMEEIHWIDFTYPGSLLEAFPGVYMRNLHSAGQYNQINIRGEDWRSVAVLQNGRLMNDPASGIYNLYQYSTEYPDRVELITGPRAFLYGLNSAAGSVNFVTRNYNSNRPFTKLNYSQGGWGYAYTDGTFSQNISRKLNVTMGFQFQGVDGRFVNSLHEVWNVRGKLRYNVSKALNIILSDYYTTSKTDLNGGIDLLRSRDPFDPRLAVVRNAESYDKITRHDADLSVVGTFFEDSVNVSTLNVYYSNNFREYRDEENRYDPSNGIMNMSDHTSSWMGGTLSQNYHTQWQRFNAGLNVELRQVEGSPNIGRRRNTIASAWGKEEFLLGEFLTVAGFGRFETYLKKQYLGWGADATLRLSPSVTLFGGFSFSNRMPNYMELYWTDSTVTREQGLVAEQHRGLEAGAEIRWPGSDLRIAYFHRTVNDPILFQPTPGTHVFPAFSVVNGGSIATNGVEARLRMRLWLLYLEGNGSYLVQTAGGSELASLPKLSLSGGIYFWSTLLQEHLELKTGVRGHYRSAQDGELFNPEALAYVSNTGTRVGYASSADFVLIAHIGDAYVQFIWENPLDIEYYATPFYPGGDRAIRFGISWEFWN